MVLRRYKWLITTVILFCGFSVGGSMPHPLYVSITEMNYNETAGTVEVSCKIFTDDLEKALEKKTGKSLHISMVQDPVIAETISAYLKEHFSINFDGKSVSLKYLGYELEKEAVWSYLEGKVTAKPKTALINNSILYDSFDQQINLVHLTVHGERKSTKLENPESKAKLDF